MTGHLGSRLTERLRLEPIGPEHTQDLWRLHQDPVVATWNAGTWSLEEAEAFARAGRRAWETDGVHKWIAYHRDSGILVGRGGLSRMAHGAPATVQIERLMGGSDWGRDRLEVGWALLSDFHGRGYASEIGREALVVASEVLGGTAVISFTERYNVASRAVMERLGMMHVGEIRTRGLVEGQEEEVDDAPFAVYAIDLFGQP